MKNNKGFSLVELIIVVAIMAVLMGILAPQYIRYVEKTRIRADDSIISDMDKAASALLADEKYYTVAANTVTVTMTHATGAVSVEGLGSMATTFVNEMHTSLYGSTSAANKFKSKAYSGTATSTATYTWTQSLYTWTKSVYNGITDSKYETAQTT